MALRLAVIALLASVLLATVVDPIATPAPEPPSPRSTAKEPAPAWAFRWRRWLLAALTVPACTWVVPDELLESLRACTEAVVAELSWLLMPAPPPAKVADRPELAPLLVVLRATARPKLEISERSRLLTVRPWWPMFRSTPLPRSTLLTRSPSIWAVACTAPIARLPLVPLPSPPSADVVVKESASPVAWASIRRVLVVASVRPPRSTALSAPPAMPWSSAWIASLIVLLVTTSPRPREPVLALAWPLSTATAKPPAKV